MRGSTTGLITAATVAALGLAGCASHSSSASGGPAADRSIMLAAYTQTVGQKTAKISLTETATASDGSALDASAGPAAASGAAGSTATITASGSVDFSGRAADLLMQVQGQQLEIREIASTIYLHLPAALDKQIPGGKAWVSVDLNQLSEAKLGASFSSLTQTSQADPAQILSYLQAVARSGVHKGGSAMIRGVQTTEYDATIDLGKLAAMQKTPAAQQAMAKLAAQAGTSGYPMKVWIAQDGLIHQMQFSINPQPNPLMSSPAGTGSGSAAAAGPNAVAVTATIQLYDYGSPAPVTAPPVSQTTDLTNAVTQQVAASSSS